MATSLTPPPRAVTSTRHLTHQKESIGWYKLQGGTRPRGISQPALTRTINHTCRQMLCAHLRHRTRWYKNWWLSRWTHHSVRPAAGSKPGQVAMLGMVVLAKV
ncbi:hypothetical protein Pcinc_023613 [Petrolisthes cinctipes]|uniref:Uncharacterized protein n=1 Tax=Petrolisthes cinctipes TaxID=88211 RepID=A0AAE1FBZ2_PETCI|nr:hypothetical protein Pcinc_023613 [Petrolisthes cinctipes]